MKHYAKKREILRAAQWLGGMTPDVEALIGAREVIDDGEQLRLGNGWYARVGDWILSASGEDVAVIGDEVFRRVYEEVDTGGRVVPPTSAELRDHHVAETEVLAKRDRSSILRMAGNIAGGFCADPECDAASLEDFAEKVVRIARAIVTEVDR